VVGNAGDGRDAEHLGGPHHVLDLVQAHRAMLAVDHDEVITDRSEQLDQIRRVAADDGAEDHLALGQLRLRRIGAHVGGVYFSGGSTPAGSGTRATFSTIDTRL
jgi:hypothetical protein